MVKLVGNLLMFLVIIVWGVCMICELFYLSHKNPLIEDFIDEEAIKKKKHNKRVGVIVISTIIILIYVFF